MVSGDTNFVIPSEGRLQVLGRVVSERSRQVDAFLAVFPPEIRRGISVPDGYPCCQLRVGVLYLVSRRGRLRSTPPAAFRQSPPARKSHVPGLLPEASERPCASLSTHGRARQAIRPGSASPSVAGRALAIQEVGRLASPGDQPRRPVAMLPPGPYDTLATRPHPGTPRPVPRVRRLRARIGRLHRVRNRPCRHRPAVSVLEELASFTNRATVSPHPRRATPRGDASQHSSSKTTAATLTPPTRSPQTHCEKTRARASAMPSASRALSPTLSWPHRSRRDARPASRARRVLHLPRGLAQQRARARRTLLLVLVTGWAKRCGRPSQMLARTRLWRIDSGDLQPGHGCLCFRIVAH